MPGDICVGSSRTETKSLFRARAKLISRRQLMDCADEGETKARQTLLPARWFAMDSGHSVPGSMPSSYQTRKPRSLSAWISGKTRAESRWL